MRASEVSESRNRPRRRNLYRKQIGDAGEERGAYPGSDRRRNVRGGWKGVEGKRGRIQSVDANRTAEKPLTAVMCVPKWIIYALIQIVTCWALIAVALGNCALVYYRHSGPALSVYQLS